MKSIDAVKELVQDHIESHGWTVATWAKETSFSRQQITRWITGDTTNIRPSSVEKIAETVGMHVNWLNAIQTECEISDYKAIVETGDNFEMPAEKGYIPIVGMAEAGEDGINNFDAYPVGQADTYIKRPHGMHDQNAYGTLVEGDSMRPTLKPRQIILVSPNSEVKNGDYAVFKATSGDVLIGEYKAYNAYVECIKHNAEYKNRRIKFKDLEYCHKIVWIKL